MGWIERRYVIETFQKQTVVLCLAHIDCKKSAERIIYNNCRQGSVVDCDAALGFKAFNGYHYAEVAALIIADIAVTYREVKRIISPTDEASLEKVHTGPIGKEVG